MATPAPAIPPAPPAPPTPPVVPTPVADNVVTVVDEFLNCHTPPATPTPQQVTAVTALQGLKTTVSNLEKVAVADHKLAADHTAAKVLLQKDATDTRSLAQMVTDERKRWKLGDKKVLIPFIILILASLWAGAHFGGTNTVTHTSGVTAEEKAADEEIIRKAKAERAAWEAYKKEHPADFPTK